MPENTLDSSPRINRLSLQLANQIAAGEVVERPASVVKELMENALDAGSTSISVDIVQGGLSLIRVRDNGKGIDRDDMHLAVSRHATSKLNSLTELENIASLGFRGEALASICSVSRLSLHSKSRSIDSKAWCIDTGNETDFANYTAELIPSALPDGTMLEVRDLFFNTPARRKFLRSEKTEFRYIEDVFKRIAMSFYGVSFQLTHNKKLIKKLPAIKNKEEQQQQLQLQRLQKLFGLDFCQAATPIDFRSQELMDLGTIHLWGWVANPNYLRHQANQQYFYVNGRFVRDKLLNHAIRQAFQDLIPSDRYAAYVLYLNIDPCQVDVNVHPTKHEVRFRHSRMVHDFIISALNQAISPQFESNANQIDDSLHETPNSTSNHHSNNESAYQYKNAAPGQKQIQDNLSGLEKLYSKDNEQNSFDCSGQSQSVRESSFSESPITETSFSESLLSNSTGPNGSDRVAKKKIETEIPQGQPLTVLNSRFFIAQMKEELWLIDLKIAMPGINAFTLVKSLNGQNKLVTQRLLIPENIKINPDSVDILQTFQESLKQYGIDFTFAGPESIMLRQVAKLPFKVDFHVMFDNLLQYLQSQYSQSMQEPEDAIDKAEFSMMLSAPINREQSFGSDKQLFILSFLQSFSQKNMPQNNMSHQKAEWPTIHQCYKKLTSSDLEKLLSTQ